MKWSLILLVLLVCTSMFYIKDVHAGVFVYILPAKTTIESGKSFTVGIQVFNIIGLYGYEYILEYNASALQCTSFTKGSFFPDGNILVFKNSIDNTNGKVWYAITLLNPEPSKNGEGVIGSATFNATTSGSYTLILSTVKLSDSDSNPIVYTKADAQVIITSSTTTGTTSGTPSTSPEGSIPYDITIKEIHKDVIFVLFRLERNVTFTIIFSNNQTYNADSIVDLWVEDSKQNIIMNKTKSFLTTSGQNNIVNFDIGLNLQGSFVAYAKVLSFDNFIVEENSASYSFDLGNIYIDWIMEKEIVILLTCFILIISMSLVSYVHFRRKYKITAKV